MCFIVGKKSEARVSNGKVRGGRVEGSCKVGMCKTDNDILGENFWHFLSILLSQYKYKISSFK